MGTETMSGRRDPAQQAHTVRQGTHLRMAARSLLLMSLFVASIGLVAPRAAAAPAQLGSHSVGPNQAKSAESSGNWAGYAVSGGTFTKVAGSWIQPRATCPAKPSEGAAFWVGIDGLAVTDPTVEQIGTDSDCIAGSGPIYYAWYQMYPTKEVPLSQSKYPVVPGETIAAVSFSVNEDDLHTDDQRDVGERVEMALLHQTDPHEGGSGVVCRVDYGSPLRDEGFFVAIRFPWQISGRSTSPGALGRRPDQDGLHRH